MVLGHIEHAGPKLKYHLRAPKLPEASENTVNLVVNDFYGGLVLCEHVDAQASKLYKGCGSALMETSIRYSFSCDAKGKIFFEDAGSSMCGFLARMGFRFYDENAAYSEISLKLGLPPKDPPAPEDLTKMYKTLIIKRGVPAFTSSLEMYLPPEECEVWDQLIKQNRPDSHFDYRPPALRGPSPPQQLSLALQVSSISP